MAKVDRSAFEPQSLWVARTFRGLTSTELAKRAGLSRQVVSDLERDEVFFLPALRAVAAVLRFPLPFFFSKFYVPPKEVLHFRKGARVPEYAIAHARAHAALFMRAVRGFRLYADFVDLVPVATAAGSPEHIEHVAALFRAAVKLRTDAPVEHAIRAAEASGISVGMFDAQDPTLQGFACSDDMLAIMLSKQSVWSRRRFSTMHEVGHLVLHRTPTDPELAEREAHRFAGAVLLPPAAFRREFPRGRRMNWAALLAMKERWGVSLQAIVGRARDLGLIDDAQYRTAFIHIAQNGWRINEPAEREAEEPSVSRSFLEDLQREEELGNYCEEMDLYLENVEEALSLTPPKEETSRVFLSPLRPRSDL